ncbi:MAG TPA: hypothetical protein VHY08_05610 [Bacillota bacterium]|nr:hypothetical protein [Bacillota bacterium]
MTKLNGVMGLDADISKLFPIEQVERGEAIQLGGKVATGLNQTIKVNPDNGGVRLTISADEFTYQGDLNKSLRVVKSEFLFRNPEIIKSLGHDQRITISDPSKKAMTIKYYLQGREKESKTFSYDFNTIDSDTLIVFLQGMLLSGVQQFNCDLIAKGQRMKINVNFRLSEVAGFTPDPESNLPEKLVQFLAQKTEKYIYEMKLTGVLNLIVPGKYYYVFEKTLPHRLIAYWGGTSNQAELAYILP